MKKNVMAPALLAGISLLSILSQTSAAADANPMFKVLRSSGDALPGARAQTAQQLKTWSGSWTYNGTTYPFTMVGTDPSRTDTTTTIKTYIVPLRMVYPKKIYGKNGRTFDPDVDMWNGLTITQALVNSPVFATIDWKWGSTDMGTTQYVDAFQRGSFWGSVGTNTNYHVVLAPKVLSEVTIRPTPAEGGAVIENPFGKGKVGEMGLRSFDEYLQLFIKKFAEIHPASLALFVTDNVYLTSGGCCIGGYYGLVPPKNQPYAYATFMTSPGAFAQDISAVSNEIAQFYDDPLINNNQTPCGGELSVTGPFGGKANYGTFDVTYNNITWHAQTAAFLEYFGAPANFSANNWLDDQDIESQVCQDGP